MQNTALPASEAWTWMRAGFERVWREPARWLGMALIYLLAALVLKRIPFFGNYVLALLTPIAVGGALLAARSTLQHSPAGAHGWLRALGAGGLRELFQVFRREEHAFAIIVVCIVTLGLFVLISIPELLITGGSIVSGIAGASLGGPLRPITVVNLVVALALYAVLAMALLYIVPLALFGNRQAIPATAESFRACVRQRKALALFLAPFLLVNFLTTFAFNVSYGIGYVLLATVGVIALPAFVVGLHESYRAIFEAPPVAVATRENPVVLR
jgi:hypothetical protein